MVYLPDTFHFWKVLPAAGSCWVMNISRNSALQAVAAGAVSGLINHSSHLDLPCRDTVHRRALGVLEFYRALPQHHLQYPAVWPDKCTGSGKRTSLLKSSLGLFAQLGDGRGKLPRFLLLWLLLTSQTGCLLNQIGSGLCASKQGLK